MKTRLICISVLSFIFLSFVSTLQAQTTTAHCSGAFTIDDQDLTTLDHYDVGFRVETSASWFQYPLSPIGQFSSQVTNQAFGPTDVVVPYPSPLPMNYYRIRIIVIRYYNNGSAPVQHNHECSWTNLDANNNLVTPSVVVVKY